MIETSSPKFRHRWHAVVLLGAVGLLLNLFPLTLSPGVHWLFGGIAYLMAAAVLGPFAGLLAGAAAGIATIPLWHHPWAWVIITMEGFLVGAMVARWQVRTLTAAAVFWAIVGLPLVLLFYRGVMGVEGMTLTMIALKQPLNGLVNAAMAEVLLLVPRLRSWLGLSTSPRLRSALSVLTLTAALFPALVFGAWTGRREWARSVELADSRVLLLARSYSSKLEQYVLLHQQSLRSMAHVIGGQNDMDEHRLTRILSAEHVEFPGFEALLVLNPEGIPIAVVPTADTSDRRTAIAELWTTTLARMLRDEDMSAISDVLGSGSGAPTVIIGHPILFEEGPLIGYIVGSLDLQRFPQPLLIRGEPDRVRVFDRSGRLVSDLAEPYRPAEEPRLIEDTAEFRAVGVTGVGGTTVVARTSASTAASRAASNVLIGHEPIESLGWWVWVEHPFTTVEAAVAVPFSRLLALLSAFVVVAAVASTLVAGWLAAPLLRLRWAAAALAGGHRDVRVRALPAGAPRELEELATGFDEMADALSGRADELEELSEIARSLASTLETGPLLRHITNAAYRLVAADGCGISFIAAGESEMRVDAYSLGLLEPAAGREIPVEDSLVGWVVKHARPARVTRVGPGFTLYGTTVELAHVGSVIAAPLIGRSGPLGALTAVRSRANHPFSADNLQLLERLARTAAIAVENARLIETARSASRAKSDFIAAMSHELRTPLNAVLGHLQLLELEIHGPLAPKQHGALKRIGTATRHLRGLIEEVLSFARLEAGRTTVEITEANLAELVEEVASVIEPLAAEKNLRVNLVLPSSEEWVRTDPDKVRQILINLAGNAVKFTDAGEVRLSIEHRLNGSQLDGAARKESLVVTVMDTGPGIAAADLSRLFRPFEQLDSGLSRKYGGTGLGLYLSRQYASMIGGVIELESEPGSGSVFSLVLPLETKLAEAVRKE